jgi:thiamine-phosphate diphosphorylase
MVLQLNRDPLKAPPLLCLVTNRSRLPRSASSDGRAELIAFVKAAVRAGIDLIQIRERDLTSRDLYELVRDSVEAARDSQAHIIVNDRIDVALAAGAAGVHLRSDSLDASGARRIVPAGFLIGRSVHSPAEAAGAAEDGEVDYLIAGTVFPSASKPVGHTLIGIDGLRAIVQLSDVPVLAIGGVTAVNIGATVSTGAAGIAAIEMFTKAGAKTEALTQLVHEARRAFDTSGRVP